MKKILFIIAVMLLVFVGCEDAIPKTKNNIDIDDKIEDAIEKKFPDIDDIDENEKADIEDDMFDDLGESVEEVIAERGKITVSEWVNGPVYKFSDNDFWYAFSEYEMTDNGYTPKGICNQLIVPLYRIIETKDGVIDIDTLVEVSDSKVSRSYDSMDEVYCYEITHDEYVIIVYADQNGDVSGDSSARVKLR